MRVIQRSPDAHVLAAKHLARDENDVLSAEPSREFLTDGDVHTDEYDEIEDRFHCLRYDMLAK